MYLPDKNFDRFVKIACNGFYSGLTEEQVSQILMEWGLEGAEVYLIILAAKRTIKVAKQKTP